MEITKEKINEYKNNGILKEILPCLLKIVEHTGKYSLYLKKNQVYKQPICSQRQQFCQVPNVQLPADIMLENFIINHFNCLKSDIPVISEETINKSTQLTNLEDKTFFCVDPLDGSYCFANNEQPFSIQLALISKGEPILGISHYPVQDKTYFGHYGIHSKIKENGEIFEMPKYTRHNEVFGNLKAFISNASSDREGIKKYLHSLGIVNIEITGGCPNLCSIMEGKCDVFPIFHPNYEWDTAAYDAILRYSNDNTPCIFNLNGSPLKYGHTKQIPFKNPHIIATPNMAIQEKIYQTSRLQINHAKGNCL